MRKVERQLWYGNEDLQEKGFDGILKQVREGASQNVLDLKGSAPTPLLLQEALGEVYSAPNFGRPDCIYVEPRLHSELIKQSVESGRHDQFQVAQSGSLTFGQSQLNIMAPYGAVPVKAAPFLHFASRMPAAGFGSLAPAAPVITSNTVQAETVGGSSQFIAGDPAYKYAVIAVGDQGYSSPVKSGALNINADEELELVIAASGKDRGASQAPRYYRIYRTAANGLEDSFRLIAEIKAESNAATTFVDLDDGNNGQKHGCSPILFAQHDPQVMEFVRLLDFIRRPLAETASVKPFLLMLFGSPVVKVPGKMYLMDNAGLSTSGLIKA